MLKRPGCVTGVLCSPVLTTLLGIDAMAPVPPEVPWAAASCVNANSASTEYTNFIWSSPSNAPDSNLIFDRAWFCPISDKIFDGRFSRQPRCSILPIVKRDTGVPCKARFAAEHPDHDADERSNEDRSGHNHSPHHTTIEIESPRSGRLAHRRRLYLLFIFLI